MAGKPATLGINITGDADDAVDAFDRVTRAARDMGDTVDVASRQADDGASRLDKAASASDNLATKQGQLTGALGALSSGFELVGAEKYATQIQSAAMATDFLSGVGDIATLALESQALQTVKTRVATAAHTVATKAQAAATRTMTVAQRALNIAMRANPIGLAVTALALLVAGFVLAYRRSETFRNIVQGVMRTASAAVGWVVDKVMDLVGWFRDRLPGAVDKVRDKAGELRDKFGAAWTWIKDKGVEAFNLVTAPMRTAIGYVDKLLDKIKSIDLPNIPGFGRAAVGRPVVIAETAAGAAPSQSLTINAPVTVNGFVGNELQLADVIARILYDRARRMGWPITAGSGLTP